MTGPDDRTRGDEGAAPDDEVGWDDESGLVALPSGLRIRGRALSAPACPADFCLALAEGPLPAWPYRRIAWPDFWIPTDRADALDALGEALRRARAGERVEAGCRGGRGRTGTALAALAVLDGWPATDAVDWVRAAYHPRAVETPWQRAWLRRLRPAG
jgi:hypothetical protein